MLRSFLTLSLMVVWCVRILAENAGSDPELYVPFCRTPPVIDGKVSPEEWKHASAISMLTWDAMRLEQPHFLVCWDGKNLYVAMESIESSTNTIVASCILRDHLSLIGDDCVELMVAPGAGEEIKRFDFPTLYYAVNSLGTIWDAKFYPNLNECHNSWESGAEVASGVDGTYWGCEMRIPTAPISNRPVKDGDRWRMNFDRTYAGYIWSAWKAGGLNDARTGGDVTFDSRAAAVRLLSPGRLADGHLKVSFEVANPTPEAQKVRLRIECSGEDERGKGKTVVGKDEKEISVNPGGVGEVNLGRDERLLRFNKVTLEATDDAGRRLFFLTRDVQVPSPRIPKILAPQVPLVHVYPRFLPSAEKLAVIVDYSAWVKKTGYVGGSPRAEIRVLRQGDETAAVMEGSLTEFTNSRGTWRQSTRDLAEGNYTVRVKVLTPKGDTLVDYDDWFEKRIFDWMRHPRGVGDDVPAPYTPLEVAGSEVKPWGRRYRLAPSGLLSAVSSQGRDILTGAVELVVEKAAGPAEVKVATPFSFVKATPAEAQGGSSLEAGDLQIDLRSRTEYDGFILYRLTCSPKVKGTPAALRRLRLRVPIAARHAKFYSASGDTQGTSVLGDVLPTTPGKVFDSLTNTRSVCCSPSFCTLFWVADHEVSFCYAADSDQGWRIRDDAPAVEAYREGDNLILWLNLIDAESVLTEPRTMEFAFQAGPLKPRPEGWRGIQFGGDPQDAPKTVFLAPHAGSGYTLAGGTHFIHPGENPELRDKARQRLEQSVEGGNKAVMGYHYWATVPKGFPETRVFRSEWGITRDTWDKAREVRTWEWQNRFYGENKDLYIIMHVNPVPSYVDFMSYAYDEALTHSPLSGFYDDTGYPKPVFDEELGLGFIREDGRKIHSSGLWVYRDRWKRAAFINARHGRPNFIMDSQHVHAHFMPAYGFIGLWAPCERGYYNPFNDRDILGFYGSLDRYAAYNPAAQFGQIPMVGMSTRQGLAPDAARETRCMMMLALLHDQDVGSFGNRDTRTVCRLRHARNLLKPWDKDVRFIGYWQSPSLVSWDAPGAKVSLFLRPSAALVVIGNAGEEAATVTLEPDWPKLGLVPGQTEAQDAETGAKLPLNAGRSGTGLRADVPRHDLRLVLLGPPGQYAVEEDRAGENLARPAEVIADLSDRFRGPELAASWEKDLHEGNAWAGILDGRLCVQSAHYGYGHVRRAFGQDNVSVQCLILRAPTGCEDTSGGSLFLIWKNGSYVQATPGTCAGKFTYVVSGAGRKSGSDVGKTSLPGWSGYWLNWVRVVLRPDKIEFCGSRDGERWVKDWDVARGEAFAGPPEFLLLGNGHPGKNPLLKNVISQHYQPAYGACTFFSDLVVGKGVE